MSPPWRSDVRSWGGTDAAEHVVERPANRDAAAALLSAARSTPTLPFGCGRSYGDVGLNPGGGLIDCRGLDRFISFDAETGVLSCEAGVQLAEILAVLARPAPDGSAWFLPVTPGTSIVTVGGAIANDVHGKNHHRFGTFGRHVLGIELARTDGSRHVCSPTENRELFAATIGGLGLTGVILAATLQLRHVPGLGLDAEDIRFDNLDEFLAISEESDRTWEYTAAWVDCPPDPSRIGRGIFSRANHVAAAAAPAGPTVCAPRPRVDIPFVLPFSVVNGLTARGLNALYWTKLRGKPRSQRISRYAPVLYPLDAIGHWNRLYGKSGFYQFQCAIPAAAMRDAIAELLRVVAASDQRSPLAVLKMFGDLPSPGLLSFPMPGATLALDFANRGATTQTLLGRLEQIVRDAGGRLYAAKDRLMSAETFARGFPNAAAFRARIDPGLASGFARRVGLNPIAETSP